MIQLVALLSCIGMICAEQPYNHNVHNERMIGGYNAPPNKWRWQVSVQFDAYGRGMYYHLCGGTLIDQFYILTAAHCIMSMDPALYRVVIGEHNLYEYSGTEQFSPVERIFVHPGWTGIFGNGNDIALMRLATPVYDNGFASVAEVPYANQMLPHNYPCYITGWGLMSSEGISEDQIPDILQEAPIKVVEHSVCSTPQWWGNIAQKSMVCAGGDGMTTGCQGDSGGPLNCYTEGAWRVHGVVSYGPAGECNQVSKPTVFTRVSNYQDWIYSVIAS